MTTLEELQQKEKKAKELLKDIETITNILMYDSMTLLDIEANKESLDNTCYELKETIEEIVKLRLWLDFESQENNVF